MAVRLPGGQQREAVIQPRGDLLHREHLHARPRPARSPAECRPGACRSATTSAAFCSLSEKPELALAARSSNSRTLSMLASSFSGSASRAVGQRQRRHLPDRLTEQPQPFDAGGQDSQRRAGRPAALRRIARRPGSDARSCPAPAGPLWPAGDAAPFVISGSEATSRTCSACAISCGIRFSSERAARLTHSTPSLKFLCAARAVSIARRVLPTPPGPVSVSRPRRGQQLGDLLELAIAADETCQRNRNVDGGGCRSRAAASQPRNRRRRPSRS